MTSELRELLERERHGTLATLSIRRAGWPFASIAPYALTDGGEPILLLSDLAEHTRNLQADARASLLVQDHDSIDDPQAGARVTLLGTVTPVDATMIDAAARRYVSRHPQANDYLRMADFRFYVLGLKEARFVNGFGDMGWLPAAKLR